jgi:signal transduction histidine kinase
LGDFARAVYWLEAQRRKGRARRVLGEYFRRLGLLLRDSLDAYEQTVEDLDGLCGGLFRRPVSLPAPAAPPWGKSLLDHLHAVAAELRERFDRLAACDESAHLKRWTRILLSSSEYRRLLLRLIGEFGNFEALVPMLPGTGPIVTDPRTQQRLDRMYRINTRNLRALELGYYLARSWLVGGGEPTTAFFDPRTNLNHAVAGMLREYLFEADPARILARRQAAKTAGEPFVRYRFWRAAENLRLMAGVDYAEPTRMPHAQRRYVEVALTANAPELCTDRRRLEWALKEVFNNALAASSHIYTDEKGRWIAQPLPRHLGAEPSAAIRMTLEDIRLRPGRRKWRFLRLRVIDEGVGIAPEHIGHVTLWSYSPRREEVHRQVREKNFTREHAWREVQLGGKGIGLAYAAAVVRDHGGELTVEPNPGGGVMVTLLLPVPTPLRV